jgi:hypothetical protein
MPLRNPTNEETQRIIHASLNNVFVFEHDPDDPDFLSETISWEDILSIPPVTKTFIRTSTLVAAMQVIPGSHPTLAPKAFFKHLDDTKQETVKEYRDFLRPRLILRTK